MACLFTMDEARNLVCHLTNALPQSSMVNTLVMSQADLHQEPTGQRLRLKVPREDGSLYSVPPLADALQLAHSNRDILADAQIDVQGRSLAVLRTGARKEMCQTARDYTATWTDTAPCTDSTELIYVTGHQPLLFHPGVWVKNFAVGNLAQQPGALGINLVVDNDTFTSPSLRIPGGNRQNPSFGYLDFDRGHAVRPWEGAEIQDRKLFESFGTRTCDAMAQWGFTPLMQQLWPLVVERSRTSPLLADCFTAARNQLERQWGARNLELPLSRLCCQDSFLWFFSHIVAQLPRFRETYNSALAEYRQVNKIRSRTHPVPELRQQDGWQEAPFWIWRDISTERRPVYARQAGPELHLQDGETVFARLPLTPDSQACCAVEVLRELPKQGLHLRTRALTTTLFTRLCFADLFLHGIGGAKYDEMTDRIMARFYGLTPPTFMSVSATVLLPMEPFSVTAADVTKSTSLLRNLQYNPEQFFGPAERERFESLLVEKQNLLAETDSEHRLTLPRSQRRARRHTRTARDRRLREITNMFAQAVESQAAKIEQDRQELSEQLAANQVLASREFSFALYPEQKLKQFMSRITETEHPVL